ncbi:hypothetical protein OAT67_08200 [Bacteriovoracaceae bacterium]|nr:hypothetical protein [Bacteriovoracaceae bacterium]
MEVVKKSGDLTIVKKRSGRYGVKDKNGKWLNGPDKVKVLLGEGLIKAAEPKAAPVEEAPAEEAPVAEAEAETEEAPAE